MIEVLDLTTALLDRKLLIFDFDGNIADTSALQSLAFEDSQTGFLAAQSANIAFINVQRRKGRCFSDFGRANTPVTTCPN